MLGLSHAKLTTLIMPRFAWPSRAKLSMGTTTYSELIIGSVERDKIHEFVEFEER